MSYRFTKLGVLALLVAALLILGGVGRGGVPSVEADLATPGGISALPTGGPAIPGVGNQQIPAIIRARAPGNHALVSVFCDPKAQAPWFADKGTPLSCPDENADGTRSIQLKIERLFPSDTPAAATFTVTGSDELVCNDNAGCDYLQTTGVVVVQVDGGGENEIVEVRATDEFGESRAVQIVVVDTVFAWGPTGPVSTASQEFPAFISYACDDVGSQRVDAPEAEETPAGPAGFDASLTAYGESFGDDDGVLGLDDLWELLYDVTGPIADVTGTNIFGFNVGKGLGLANNALEDIDVPLYWCGGDTMSPFDDFVDFETDKGIFSIDPAAQSVTDSVAKLHSLGKGLPLAPFFDIDCGEGKAVDVFDVDSFAVWGNTLFHYTEAMIAQEPLPLPLEGGCDVDFAPNGVVTAMLLGTGEVGVAAVTAQQGGGVSPPRNTRVTFLPEPGLSLFLTAPAVIGTEGGEFTAAVVGEGFRVVGNATVQCTVSPPDTAFMVVPATGTTGSFVSESPGQVSMRLVPTGAAVVEGETITLTCVVDRARSVKAVAVIKLSTTPQMETVDLVPGCNPVVSTWDDGTDIAKVAGSVAPAEALDAIWAFDPETGTALGFSPAAPEVSDLASVDLLDAFFVCANARSMLSRPVI